MYYFFSHSWLILIPALDLLLEMHYGILETPKDKWVVNEENKYKELAKYKTILGRLLIT